jgi:hypothetical protein
MRTIRIECILISILLIGITGCKQKSNVITCNLSDTFKKDCIFKKNSYWIYKNDTTGTIDSTSITNSSTTGYSSSGELLMEYNETPLKSTLFYQFYSRALEEDNLSITNYFIVRMYQFGWCGDSGIPAYVLYEDTLTNHSGGLSTNCGSWKYPLFVNYSFTQLGKQSGFGINGLVFDRVDLTRATFNRYDWEDTPPLDLDTFDFYFSPGHGLVKFILRIDTSINYQYRKRATMSWSLLRYRVVK